MRTCSRPTIRCRLAQDMTGFTGGLVKGWQVNAVANWQGGTPSQHQQQQPSEPTPAAAIGRTSSATRCFRRTSAPCSEWFNTAACVGATAVHAGQRAATIMHGPPQRRLDLAIFKQIELGGPHSLQLRYEVYNITNTANFQNPNGSLGDGAYRHDHVNGQRHPASDAVRGEVPVLVRIGSETRRPGSPRPGRLLRQIAVTCRTGRTSNITDRKNTVLPCGFYVPRP